MVATSHPTRSTPIATLAPSWVYCVRADRRDPGEYTLAPPVRLDSGAWRFEAVLSTPGVNRYPGLGAAEYVDPAALRDPAYLAGLAGVPIIDAPDLHWPGVTVDDLTDHRVGSVLSARWDEEQQATIGVIVIDTPRGISRVMDDEINGLSLHYRPIVEKRTVAPDGTSITGAQVARSGLNHVLLTPTPNDPPSRARTRADDDGEPMTPEQIQALRSEIVTAIKGARADEDGDGMLKSLLEMLLAARSDAMRERDRADQLQAAMDEAKTKADMEHPDKEDEAEARADAIALSDVRAVLDLAADLGVTLDDTATLGAARRAIVSVALPARADAAPDQLHDLVTLIAGARAAAGGRAANDWTRTTGTTRADSGAPSRSAYL